MPESEPLVHYCTATAHCAGGRNDVGDWSRVTCPACLESRPPPSHAPEVLTVVLADTNRTYVAIVHEGEHVPYRRRTVQVTLTPEQRAALEPRLVFAHPDGDVREEILTCWLEPLPNQD